MKLLVYGSGGFGKEVLDTARRMNRATPRWDGFEFIEDVRPPGEYFGIPVRTVSDALARYPSDEREVIIAVGEPRSRVRLREELGERGVTFGRVIDPSAIIAESAVLGDGVIVSAFCIVASSATLGDNVVLNVQAIAGHDVSVERDTVLSSMVNIGGACTVGTCSYIGMGAQVKDKISIGDRTILGMGSVLHDSLGDDLIAMGNPARAVRRNVDNVIFR